MRQWLNPDTVFALEKGGWFNDVDGYPGRYQCPEK